MKRWFRRPALVRWMERQVGPYPFDTSWFTAAQQIRQPTRLHERAHRWFGDSVSPQTWSDVWLDEGHATWDRDTYAASRGGTQCEGASNVTDLMHQLYAVEHRYRAVDGPLARPRKRANLFHDDTIYDGGALVRSALSQKIGPVAFQKVEWSWVPAYRGRSASTDEVIALASRVSGRDVTGFLQSWLYGTRTPPMPGHPGWTVDPAAPRS